MRPYCIKKIKEVNDSFITELMDVILEYRRFEFCVSRHRISALKLVMFTEIFFLLFALTFQAVNVGRYRTFGRGHFLLNAVI